MTNFHGYFGFNIIFTKDGTHRRGTGLDALVYIERFLKAKQNLFIDISNISDDCALQSRLVPVCYARADTWNMPGCFFEGPGETAENPSGDRWMISVVSSVR